MNNDIDIQVLLNGNVLQAKGLARFSYITPSSAKQYLIYTLNEKTIRDDKELTKIYVSETSDSQGYQFQPINPEEWEELKKIMNQLRQPDATVPTNVQIATLKPTQYTVGEYKKIGVDDAFTSYLLANQIANEPKDETIIPPSGSNTQFFDPAVVQEIDKTAPQPEEPAIPDAFSMSAPVQEAAPAAPVTTEAVAQAQPVAPVQVEQAPAPVEAAPTQLVQPVTPVAETPQVVTTIEQPVVNEVETPALAQEVVQPVETPQVVQEATPAIETPQFATPVEQVVQTATDVPQDVIDGFKKFLDYVGADMNKVNEVLNVNGMQEVPSINNEEESVEVTPVTTTPIDINDLPVIPQEPVGEEEPLVEEPIVPGAPSLPVDDMISQPVAEPTPVTAPEPTTTPYVAATNNGVTPVETPSIEIPEPVQPIVETPEVIETPTLQPEAVAPQIEPVQTEVVQAPSIEPVPTAPEVAQPMQEPATIDTSFLDAAGPVVMPVGQESVTSQGLPGDSGVKSLEKVA